MKKSKLEKVYFFLILLLIKTELYDRISIYKRGGTMEQYRIIYDIMKCPNSCLEQSWPFTNKKAYDSAKKYVEYYYQSTKIFFEYDLYTNSYFSNLFEMYKKSKNTKYWKLIKLLVNIKQLKDQSDKWGENMENPWLRTLEKKLQMFKPFIYDLLIMAYDNKMFDGLDYSSLPRPLANAYKKIKAQRRLDQFYETLKGRPSNLDEDIAEYFLEKEKYELGETKKKKQIISLEEEANKRKPHLPTLNRYYNDTDYSDTKEEFDLLLPFIKSNQRFIESFIGSFDNNSLISLYAKEKSEEFEELVQNYCNYKAIGAPCTDYDKKNADQNCRVSNVYSDFEESIQKFLTFASDKGDLLTPIEWLSIPDNIKSYFRDPDYKE